MKAIGYIRVSTAQQREEGVSLEDQRQKIEDYCQFKDMELVGIIADEGVSGGKPLSERGGGAELLSRVENEEIKAVIAVKLDRLFRDAVDALNTTKEWDEDGIALHLLDMGGSNLDTSSAMGRMFLTMMAGFAEMERNLIAERTQNALHHKKKNGEVYNHAPLGFKVVDGKLVKDEQEQKIVELIIRMDAEGHTLTAIAEELNRRGYDTKRGGKKWYPQTVSNVLKKDIYKDVAV